MTVLIVLITVVLIVHEWATMPDDYLAAENEEDSTYLGSMY